MIVQKCSGKSLAMKSSNNHKYTINEVESILNKMFKGRWCSFEYPGKSLVYGIVDYIVVDIRQLPAKEFKISMGNKLYSVSTECLHECLKVLNGSTRTTNSQDGGRPDQND